MATYLHRLLMDMDYGLRCMYGDAAVVVALYHDGERWWPVCGGCIVEKEIRTRSIKCLNAHHATCSGCGCTCHEEAGLTDLMVVARLLAKSLTHRDSHLVVSVKKTSDSAHVQLTVHDTMSERTFEATLS